MKRVLDVNGGWVFSSFPHLYPRCEFPTIYIRIHIHILPMNLWAPYLFRLLTFSFTRSFCHSDTHTHTHSSSHCQQKIMFYLSIQLLCIKTYDYFFAFDIPTFRYSITWQKQGANAFWFIDLYSIFYDCCCCWLLCVCVYFFAAPPASILISFWLSVYCF